MKKTFSYLAKVLIFFAAYFITARIGLSFDAVSGFATLVWPPAGIALAALLLFGYELWPSIFAGAFLVNLITGASLPVALGIAGGNTLEAFTAAYLLKNSVGFKNSLDNLRDTIRFLAIGAFFSTIIAATIGTTSLLLGRTIDLSTYMETWVAWWIGDMLGIQIVGSLLLVWLGSRINFKESFDKKVEIFFLSLTVIMCGFLVFGYLDGTSYPVSYMVFIPVIWGALNFNHRGAITSAAAISLISIWGTTYGYGPFMGTDLADRLLYLEVFMGTLSGVGMILAAVVSERKYSEDELDNLNKDLENKVRARTSELMESEIKYRSLARDLEKRVEERTWELGERVADLQESRAKTEKERARYEALLSSVKDGVIALDKNGSVIFFNDTAVELLQWKSKEIIGKNINDFLKLEDDKGQKIPNEKRPYFDSIEHGKTIFSDNYYYIRKDGTKFPVHLTVSPITIDNKITGAMEVFSDITEAKALDRAKSEFISIASHQLRTPVTATKWLAEIFSESRGKLTIKEKGYLSDLSVSIERLSRLVEDLLNVSRIELGTLKIEKMVINPADFINNFIKDIEPYVKLKKHILVFKNESDQSINIDVDSKVLYNVIQNLVSNAIDYSSPGSTVTIVLEKEGSSVKVSVLNQGPVIPKDEQAKLFQKFYRGESTKKMKADGTGLGLYIVKSNIENAGGKIGFQSKEGEETVFWFTLPLKNN